MLVLCERGIEVGNRRIIIVKNKYEGNHKRKGAMRLISLRIPEEVYMVLKHYSRANGKTISEVIREAVVRYVGGGNG